MLIETMTAFLNRLKTIKDECNQKFNLSLEVISSERYREIIALNEKNKGEFKYPIIVVHEGDNMEYDVSRYSNDANTKKYRQVGDNIYCDVYEPLMPYNLKYKLEIICNKRIQLDKLIPTVIGLIPPRGYLKIEYLDEQSKTQFYDAYMKTGNLVNADEHSSKPLYRRMLDVQVTTFIESKMLEGSYIQVKSHKPDFYQM